MISQSPYPFDPRVRRQAEKLVREGFEVDILCLPSKDETDQNYGKINAYRILNKNPGQENIRKYLWLAFKFFIKTFFLLQRLHRTRKYALIQVHNMPEAHVFTTILQKLMGVPILLDIHDLTPELLTSKWNTKFSSRIKPFIIFIEKLSCRFADQMITVTEGCKEILVGRGVPPEKITLVLNTASTSIFQFNENRRFRKISNGVKLLYHGTVADRFGLHIVIDALPLLLKQIPGSILMVYGKYDADYRQYLVNKIKELHLEKNVILGDVKTHEELYDIMNEADIEVVPYISNEYMNLSLSTKIFECAAVGLPIIATNLRTLRLTFDHNAVRYVTDQSPEDFAFQIAHLCLNPEERMEMVQHAYRAITDISGDIMEKRYSNLVKRMTGYPDYNNGYKEEVMSEPDENKNIMRTG